MKNVKSNWTPRFEFANKGTLYVRYEHLRGLDLSKRFRILYASDLHLNAIFTKSVCIEIINTVKSEKPDLLRVNAFFS